MSMKDAFIAYFEVMNASWMRVWGTKPKTVANKRHEECSLYISEIDEDGYFEWQPKLQTTKIDFEQIEYVLGFKIHPQIKEFLSTYWFLPLKGTLKDVDELQLDEILPQHNMIEFIKQRYNKQCYHYLNDSESFLIGSFCCINGNDSYLLHVNNDTGAVSAVHIIDKKSILIANSIEELLTNMNGEWG